MSFEKAVMNAFSGQFPNKIRLKSVYETNDEVRTYVRCLPVLAFVPPDDVNRPSTFSVRLSRLQIIWMSLLRFLNIHTFVAADDVDVQRYFIFWLITLVL